MADHVDYLMECFIMTSDVIDLSVRVYIIMRHLFARNPGFAGAK